MHARGFVFIPDPPVSYQPRATSPTAERGLLDTGRSEHYEASVRDPAFKRSQRVGQQIQRELAALLVDGLKDPRVGFTTVTEVRLTDDLKSARVYVSVYGTETEKEDSLAGLKDASGYLKREIGRRLSLRYVPNLVFAPDDTLDQARRLDRILAAVSGEGEVEDLETMSSTDGSAMPAIPVQTARSALAGRRQELAAAAESQNVSPDARNQRSEPAARKYSRAQPRGRNAQGRRKKRRR